MPQRECVRVFACVCVAYFLFLFICATADSHGVGARRCGKYLSEADLCCLEAQHFKPSLSCVHKYQNSSLCCAPCRSKRPLLLRLLATTEELCKFIWPSHCPFAVARLSPSPLSVGSKLLNCTELLLRPFVCSSSAYWMIFRRRDIE